MPRLRAILRSGYCERFDVCLCERCGLFVVVSRLKMFLGRFWVTVRLRFPGDED